MAKKHEIEAKFLNEAFHELASVFSRSKLDIFEKERGDYVTSADIAIEKLLVDKVSEQFPDDGILAEEGTKRGGGSRTWIIDPLDGTHNFIRGIPFFGVQMCLMSENIPQFAGIYLPEKDYSVFASIGDGAFVSDGDTLHVCRETDFENAVVTVGDFAKGNSREIKNVERTAFVTRLADRVGKVRMFGASSWDFVALASGWTDAHVMFSSKPWDVWPGVLIAMEAGAIVTDHDGRPCDKNSKNILAAGSRSINEQLLEIIHSRG